MMLASVEHSEFTLQDLVSAKRETVTVCIPTRETASTIEATLGAMAGLREERLIDQLLVIDADSADGTSELARQAGAEVFSESELMPEFGPVAGKGDAMWRGLSVAGGDIVLYLDGDIRDFGPHYAIGLLGPLLRPDLVEGAAPSHSFDFVKGFYRRPFSLGDSEAQEGGGRVTELTAKPLLELLVPELGAFSQPLAGECGARRSLLVEIPYCTRYGVEIAMLIEVWKRVGVARMAQVGLGTKRNSHQSLAELGKMSRQVVEALVTQTQWEKPGIGAADSSIAAPAEGSDLGEPESEGLDLGAEPGGLDLGAVRPAAGWQSHLDLRPPMASLAPREGTPALSPSEAVPR